MFWAGFQIGFLLSSAWVSFRRRLKSELRGETGTIFSSLQDWLFSKRGENNERAAKSKKRKKNKWFVQKLDRIEIEISVQLSPSLSNQSNNQLFDWLDLFGSMAEWRPLNPNPKMILSNDCALALRHPAFVWRTTFALAAKTIWLCCCCCCCCCSLFSLAWLMVTITIIGLFCATYSLLCVSFRASNFFLVPFLILILFIMIPPLFRHSKLKRGQIKRTTLLTQLARSSIRVLLLRQVIKKDFLSA